MATLVYQRVVGPDHVAQNTIRFAGEDEDVASTSDGGKGINTVEIAWSNRWVGLNWSPIMKRAIFGGYSFAYIIALTSTMLVISS